MPRRKMIKLFTVKALVGTQIYFDKFQDGGNMMLASGLNEGAQPE